MLQYEVLCVLTIPQATYPTRGVQTLKGHYIVYEEVYEEFMKNLIIYDINEAIKQSQKQVLFP